MTATTYGMGAETPPFRESPWSGESATAAAAFWGWHKALASPKAPALDGADLDFFFDSQAEAIRGGRKPDLVEDVIWLPLSKFAKDDRVRSLLAEQIAGARTLVRPAVSFDTRVSLQEFMDGYVAPHAMLLASLCGASRDFQRPRISAIGEALFLQSRLVCTPDDLEAGRNYFVKQELDELAIDERDIVASPPSEAVRKLVWRRIVWIRDALARGMPLAEEIPRPIARYLKHVVMLSLEVLAQIERDDFDIGRFEPGLSKYHRAQAWIQSRFGRTAWH